MAQDFKVHSVVISDPGADNKQIPILVAPSDIHGGGLTVLEAEAMVHDSVTNSLGVGGTTFTLALHRYSAVGDGGTPAVNGTIAAAIGGTAQGWTAGVVNAFTIDTDYAFIDAGEYVMVDYQELNNGSPAGAGVVVNLVYVPGK